MIYKPKLSFRKPNLILKKSFQTQQLKKYILVLPLKYSTGVIHMKPCILGNDSEH